MSQRLPRSAENIQGSCVVTGHVSISRNWYGYLAVTRFKQNKGTMYYKFRYPQKNCCVRILLYLREQFDLLKAFMNCAQREAILDPRSNQVLVLSPGSGYPGCVANVTGDDGKNYIECSGGLVLKTNVKTMWYIAASSCGFPTGLTLEYRLHFQNLNGSCRVNRYTNSGTRFYCGVIALLIIIYSI